MTNPAPKQFFLWFQIKNKKLGTIAFIVNRLSAIGLTVYLFLHLVMLSQLVQGQEAYNNFIKLAKTPLIEFGEILVIAGGIIHGLNGVRIALNNFGIAVKHQKIIFIILLIFSIILTAIFVQKMVV